MPHKTFPTRRDLRLDKNQYEPKKVIGVIGSVSYVIGGWGFFESGVTILIFQIRNIIEKLCHRRGGFSLNQK